MNKTHWGGVILEAEISKGGWGLWIDFRILRSTQLEIHDTKIYLFFRLFERMTRYGLWSA